MSTSAKSVNLRAKPSSYGYFPEEKCTLTQLRKRAQALSKNQYLEAMELSAKIDRQFRRFVEQTKHDFSTNLSTKRMINRPEKEDLNANDAKMGFGKKYLLFACPRDLVEAGSLFDAALQDDVSLIVSLLESHEGETKFNNFWKEEKLAQIVTNDGWTLSFQSSQVLGKATKEPEGIREPQIIETTFLAKGKNGEVRTLKHLHFEGWRDREALPSHALFHLLLERIAELQKGKDTPFAINCHGGVGRTGTTALSDYLRREVDSELASGKKPETIEINIPDALFAFRVQRNGFLGQSSQLANVYSILADYVDMKIKQNGGHVVEVNSDDTSIDAIDQFYQFADEAIPLSNLKDRISELQKNDALGFEELNDKINVRFQHYLKRQKMEGKKHNFDENLSVKRMQNRTDNEQLDANDVEMGKNRNYLLHACPRTLDEVNTLLDAALQKNVSLFVSTLKSSDATDRYNNFWSSGKVSEVNTRDGWTITNAATRVLVSGAGQQETKIIETTLFARKGNETRVLTHLHYDGWDQDKAIPDRALFQRLLDRIEALQEKSGAPFAVNSLWGVGRNGTTAISHFLRQELDAQLASGIPLDQAKINIPKAIFEFRKQRNGFVEHAPLLADVYAVLADYYERVSKSSKT